MLPPVNRTRGTLAVAPYQSTIFFSMKTFFNTFKASTFDNSEPQFKTSNIGTTAPLSCKTCAPLRELCIERTPIRAAALVFADTEPFFRKSTRSAYDSRLVNLLSPPPATVEPSATPPHPKSYMDVNHVDDSKRQDLPPNQRVSNPRLAPKPKPWEVAQSQGIIPTVKIMFSGPLPSISPMASAYW
ncbi:hypothetical protein Tco_1487613 [Tanacetum coccineum]